MSTDRPCPSCAEGICLTHSHCPHCHGQHLAINVYTGQPYCKDCKTHLHQKEDAR